MTESKKDASRLAWERPVLRRLDASDAQNTSNKKDADFTLPSGIEGSFRGANS